MASYNDPIMKQRREQAAQRSRNATARSEMVRSLNQTSPQLGQRAAGQARVAQLLGQNQVQAVQPFYEAGQAGFTTVPQMQRFQDQRAQTQANTGLTVSQTGVNDARAGLLGAQTADVPAARATADYGAATNRIGVEAESAERRSRAGLNDANAARVSQLTPGMVAAQGVANTRGALENDVYAGQAPALIQRPGLENEQTRIANQREQMLNQEIPNFTGLIEQRGGNLAGLGAVNAPPKPDHANMAEAQKFLAEAYKLRQAGKITEAMKYEALVTELGTLVNPTPAERKAITDQMAALTGAPRTVTPDEQEAALQNRTPVSAGQGQQITPEKAREYMQMTGGDKERARQLARQDGYTF